MGSRWRCASGGATAEDEGGGMAGDCDIAVDDGRLSAGDWRAGCTYACLACYTAPPATPLPPSANTPTPFEEKLQSAPRSMELTKVIDGYLYVRYFPPCALRGAPAIWVAPIELTDLRSRSVVHLNGNGTLKASPKPDYKTDEGRARLEAALEDSSVVEQIVARPECPDGLK